MPMPPPRPSARPHQDARTRAELNQLTRALRQHGPMTTDALAELVGAQFWDPGRYATAITTGIAEGYLIRDSDGVVSTPR